jgi:DNA-binding GntR family transcriptional regulator
VKRTDPRPPYLQVAEDLRAAIKSGRLKPGERLPSGREMAKQYGVALMTLQRALNTVAADGLIVSYQGRGAWVRSPEHTAVQHTFDATALVQRLGAMEATLEELENRVRELEHDRNRRGRRAAPAPRPSRRA